MNLSKIKWLYNRLRIMSPGEVVFRIKQAKQKYAERANIKAYPLPAYTVTRPQIDFEAFLGFDTPDLSTFHFFGLKVSLDEPIDFHKDISINKSFPLTFSKNIDTRTSAHGDAKVVWEINRLQFLLPLLIAYRKTKDVKHLDKFVSIMTSWNEQNPYMLGVNWYSNIEVNVRLINWYWCWLMLQDDEKWNTTSAYQRFVSTVWMPMIYNHCIYSHSNPSYYSSANNHLISEYAGLFVASSLWKFPESEKWLAESKAGLEKEIVLQHSSNGVNKEEAAEYIQFITDFFLVPYVVSQHHNIKLSDKFIDILSNICLYIYNFIDIKGQYPKYGDDDDGKVIVPGNDPHANNFLSILNTAAVLFKNRKFKLPGNEWDIKSALLTSHIAGDKVWSALEPSNREDRSVFYKEEGHFYFKKTTADNEIYFHFDAAPLGFLSLAAHGHADALSVMLTVDGCPFLVDPGTFTYYQSKEMRNYFMDTNVHNTISLDKKNQAHHAGAMLWLNHFQCHTQLAELGGDIERVTATHDGYKDIGGSHQRDITFNRRNDTIVVSDVVSAGKKTDNIFIHWHLHPSLTMLRQGDEFILSHPGTTRKVSLKMPAVSEVIIGEGWFSEGFLKKDACATIDCRIKNEQQQIKVNTLISII